jgi:hypothetical protein
MMNSNCIMGQRYDSWSLKPSRQMSERTQKNFFLMSLTPVSKAPSIAPSIALGTPSLFKN